VTYLKLILQRGGERETDDISGRKVLLWINSLGTGFKMIKETIMLNEE